MMLTIFSKGTGKQIFCHHDREENYKYSCLQSCEANLHFTSLPWRLSPEVWEAHRCSQTAPTPHLSVQLRWLGTRLKGRWGSSLSCFRSTKSQEWWVLSPPSASAANPTLQRTPSRHEVWLGADVTLPCSQVVLSKSIKQRHWQKKNPLLSFIKTWHPPVYWLMLMDTDWSPVLLF